MARILAKLDPTDVDAVDKFLASGQPVRVVVDLLRKKGFTLNHHTVSAHYPYYKGECTCDRS